MGFYNKEGKYIPQFKSILSNKDIAPVVTQEPVQAKSPVYAQPAQPISQRQFESEQASQEAQIAMANARTPLERQQIMAKLQSVQDPMGTFNQEQAYRRTQQTDPDSNIQQKFNQIAQGNQQTLQDMKATQTPEEFAQNAQSVNRQRVANSRDKQYDKYMQSYGGSYMPQFMQIEQPQQPKQQKQPSKQQVALKKRAQENWDKNLKTYGSTKTSRPR